MPSLSNHSRALQRNKRSSSALSDIDDRASPTPTPRISARPRASSSSQTNHTQPHARARWVEEGTAILPPTSPYPHPGASPAPAPTAGPSRTTSERNSASHLPTPPSGTYVVGEGEGSNDEDNFGPKVLAFHAPGQNNLAAAYYDPATRKLQVLEDTKDTWGWDLATLLVEQLQPDEVVLSTSAPDTLATMVQDYCSARPSANIVTLPANHFAHTMATYHLASVRLPRDLRATVPLATATASRTAAMSWSDSGRGGPGPGGRGAAPTSAAADEEGDEDEYPGEDGAGMGEVRLSLLKLGCRVNVDAPMAVCTAGALLSHLVRTQSLDIMPGNEAAFDLDGIESMDHEEHMLINQDALTSLAVFDVEAHAFMHSSAQKPGLSLNSVINTTVTPLGRKLLHTWLLRPLINIDRINARLDAVQLLSSKEYTEPRKQTKKELKGFKNVVALCQKIKSGRASYKDWQGVVDALSAVIAIKDSLGVIRLRGRAEVVEKLHHAFTDKVHRYLMDTIALIDWDMSRDEGRVCIRSQIDDELDQWREDYARLEPLLNQMSRVMAQRIPPNICEHLNVLYLPQLGCLVAAHAVNDPASIPAEWEQQFNTDEVAYFKTPEMHNLDEHYGDLQNVIIDREIEWVQRLAERLEDVEEDILALGDAVAELDCLIAFAEAVDRFDLRRPVIKEQPVLKIRKGFHPLHAMCVPTGQYIDNDTVLEGGGEGDHSSMMVVTGPNGSGKSAYGKQVALITFMAHIGCFVPAESAEIGICDKIFTRVQTRESASKTGSAFMIDLSQVSQALRGATSRSLLILDEFGKGTMSSDGAGLLAGVITFLLKGPGPRTVVLTHFHELFAQQFLDESMPIIFCHMQSLLVEDTNRLTYLFKLMPTVCMTSNAAECALNNGIPEDIVEHARKVSDYLSKFQITKLIDAQLTDEDLDDLHSAEELAKRFLCWNFDEENDVLDELDRLVEGQEKEEEEVLRPGEGGLGVAAVEMMQLQDIREVDESLVEDTDDY